MTAGPANDNQTTQKSAKNKLARPKPCYLWTSTEVQKWLKRHCNEYYQNYSHLFQMHDISGKALIHMNDETLIQLGISDLSHRDAIWREILKLRLKADILELKEIEMSSKFAEQLFLFK